MTIHGDGAKPVPVVQLENNLRQLGEHHLEPSQLVNQLKLWPWIFWDHFQRAKEGTPIYWLLQICSLDG